MKNQVEAVNKTILEIVYDGLEWLDWILVALSVAYFMNSIPEVHVMLKDIDLAQRGLRILTSFPTGGAPFYTLSLVVIMVATAVSILLHKMGL